MVFRLGLELHMPKPSPLGLGFIQIWPNVNTLSFFATIQRYALGFRNSYLPIDKCIHAVAAKREEHRIEESEEAQLRKEREGGNRVGLPSR